MVDITSISALVAALGVIVGVVFAVLQLRDLVKTRQTDLAIRLYSQVCDKEHIEAWGKYITAEYKDYNDFVEKYGPLFSDKPVPVAFMMVSHYFEGIGVLLHRKLVDIDLVLDIFAIGMLWEKMKPLAEGIRKELDQPSFYEWFEYAYNEMKKRQQTLQTQQ